MCSWDRFRHILQRHSLDSRASYRYVRLSTTIRDYGEEQHRSNYTIFDTSQIWNGLKRQDIEGHLKVPQKADGAVENSTPIDCENATTAKSVQCGDKSSKMASGSGVHQSGDGLRYLAGLPAGFLRHSSHFFCLTELDTQRSMRTHKVPSPILLYRHQPLISSSPGHPRRIPNQGTASSAVLDPVPLMMRTRR